MGGWILSFRGMGGFGVCAEWVDGWVAKVDNSFG